MKKQPRVKKWWLIRLALTIAGKKTINEMTKASKNGKKASSETLRHILTLSKDTVYGKEHHFEAILAAKTPEELFDLYQKNVKINDYEDLRPYIERHKNGERDILFPGKPKMYATTSGTTKEPKWIPVTEQYYQEVYKVMNKAWFYSLIKNRPRVFYGPCASIVGKAIEGHAPDGTVYGAASGVMQRDIPGFMQAIHTAPPETSYIADYKARYYAIMRMAIQRDTHLIISANSSTLIEMQKNANEFFDDYCDDIEHGTVSKKVPIPDDIRAALEAYTKPSPARAAELRELKKQYGTVMPKHYWPNLQMVNVWFCGNTKLYFDKITDFFPPNCAFHEFSYIASECRAGVVLKSGVPETTTFCHKIYFEFIHESDIENPNPKIYQAHEVKTGERYSILITTSGGLYRYNMNDLMEIAGFYNQFPQIKFIQKINGTISLTGEKLHERQFIEAVHEVEKKLGKHLNFYVGFAEPEKSSYKFYYEFTDQSVSLADAQAFTVELDRVLQGYNLEYREKRGSDRVKMPETALLGPDSFERFKAISIAQGSRDGQFKVNLLMQDENRQAMFEELVK